MTVNQYKVFFNSRNIEVYAYTLYGAKLMGIEHFKPRKSQQHMVHAHLIERDGQPVTHSTGDL
jgi:hypothetical protein